MLGLGVKAHHELELMETAMTKLTKEIFRQVDSELDRIKLVVEEMDKVKIMSRITELEESLFKLGTFETCEPREICRRTQHHREDPRRP